MWSYLKARDIAKSPVVSVDADISVEEAAKRMVENNVGGVLVYEGGKPAGILTERDILSKVVARGIKPSEAKVRDVMSSPLITVSPDTTLAETIDLMSKKKIRRVVVADGDRVIGIFTQRDIIEISRICGYCKKVIKTKMTVKEGEEPELYVECSCGARYHVECAKTVVYCSYCGTKLVTEVIYPEPSETMSG